MPGGLGTNIVAELVHRRSGEFRRTGQGMGSIGVGGWLMAFFLFSLPFIFYLQVTLGDARLAAPFYILPLASLGYHFFQGSFRSGKTPTFQGHVLDAYVSYLALFFFLFSIVNFMSGDRAGMQKTMLFFWSPLALYVWASRCASERALRLALTCVAAASVIVALNWLYQIYLQTYVGQVSAFQTQARDYLVAVTADADDAIRISTTAYRAPGIVEIHSHATATVVALGIFAFASHYIVKRRTLDLYAIGALFSILFMGSVRLLLAAAVITLIYYFVIGSTGHKGVRNAIKFMLLLPVIAATVLGVYAWRTGTLWETVATYYAPFIPGMSKAGESAGVDVLWQLGLDEIIRIFNGLQNNPIGFLSGFGPTRALISEELASEDFFIIHIFAFYGIVGWASMMLVFSIGVFGSIQVMRRLEPEMRAHLCFAACTLLVLWISTLHSGVLHRRALWPFFILALGIVRRYSVKMPNSEISRKGRPHLRGLSSAPTG